jgi:uncharacterized protein Yka (UPF0111/DUF47 family)
MTNALQFDGIPAGRPLPVSSGSCGGGEYLIRSWVRHEPEVFRAYPLATPTLLGKLTMNLQANPSPDHRLLSDIFKEHLDNSLECGRVLGRLFANLHEPEALIARIKQLEERGDRLTMEGHGILDALPYSETIQLTQQLVHHLDDIVDGMNNVARIVDIFMPKETQEAAQQLLSTVLAMVEEFGREMRKYPENELADVRECRAVLKSREEQADTIYHQWRKAHRRHGSLSLIAERDWTEILGILEQTTDACYHSVLMLERITKYQLRETHDKTIEG